jgi:hypothetical protein
MAMLASERSFSAQTVNEWLSYVMTERSEYGVYQIELKLPVLRKTRRYRLLLG